MKILVTGGKGFVGTQLIRYLEKKGINCISYDLRDGEDLLNKKKLEEYIREVDCIIHLAAVGDVYQVANDPQNALQVGIVGSQNLVEIANKFAIKKIIYVSTWEVYGDPKYEPIDENHPCNPDAPYSIAKYGGELVMRAKANKIPWTILRLGTIYGNNMRPNSVFSIFINKAMGNEPITLQNGGEQKRQFTHIDDISCAIYQSVLNKNNNITLNIVDDYVITIKQLALLIKKICKSKSTVIIEKPRINDPSSTIISSAEANSTLHWKPKSDFKVALINIINTYVISKSGKKY